MKMRSQKVTALLSAVILLACVPYAAAYQLLISSNDDVPQACSGMYGGGSAAIEVIFSHESRGQLALVIYEFRDQHYLGKAIAAGKKLDETGQPVVDYVCTIAAVAEGACQEANLGQFISTAPANSSSSIFTTSVQFDPIPGNAAMNTNRGPFKYPVASTGFYCVGTVPLLAEGVKSLSRFDGVVDFQNSFHGALPAAEYPKLLFYLSLCCVYAILLGAWLFMCYRNRTTGVLPIQLYIAGTMAFLVVEMFVNYYYYSYLNSNGHDHAARALLMLFAVLTATRNSISLFILLITSMGYGVTRTSLGPVLLKIRLLTAAHFVFGVLYSIGTVSIALERAGFFILFFIFPLSFSLTAFLLWIMYALNATIADLDARKQGHKKLMFTRLYRILLAAGIVIVTFFVISAFAFSSRLADDYAPSTWRTQWILLDGWLSTLYLLVLTSIAYIWRPTGNNARLAMSSELATDEAQADEADQYDIEALERGEGIEGGKSMRMRGLGGEEDDGVVFDLGEDEDEEGDDEHDEREDGEGKPLKPGPPSYRKESD